MKIAPSTYYARKQRPASNRQIRDEILKEEISTVHANNYDAFGARKMHIVLNREPDPLGRGHVARCTIERLMKDLGFQLLPRRRRCQLCAEAYIEDPPLPGRGYSDQPPICANCRQVVDRVDENLSGKFGAPISTEAVIGLIGHRITYEQFQYGRHWLDHVPSHSRHLIKEKP
ncbi:IS3 family transposase [Brevibacterium sp. K11IcPPYGO002]|uniref:IS3 family transposase n=1 Tax=Brevibacterium sp. K11IcPPYGO002 TaxID=3058837 RepID=UPI003D81A593